MPEPGHGRRLVVAIDFKDPASYLARAPTQELAADLGVEVVWRPFVAPPLVPPSALPQGDERGARHLRFRARYFENDLHRCAALQNLTLRDLYRNIDSSLAAMGLLWIQEQASGGAGSDSVQTYLELVFDSYWSKTLDIENLETIRAQLERAGATGAEFDPAAERDRFARLQQELREGGVFSVPTYLLEGQVFLGRAHLPMIRWLLQNRAGPPPI